MAISQFQLTNFRSYVNQRVELDPAITMVVGSNATGKTNLLEGLFVLATTRSFRARDAELVRHGSDHYRLEAELDDNRIAVGYRQTETGSEKRARHGNAPRSLIQHVGVLRVVLFEPNDLLLIHGAPERRRRYLDLILTQTDRGFAKILGQYRRVLVQRNGLLSRSGGASPHPNELFAWNLQLAQLASEIDARRRQLVDALNAILAGRYQAIADEAVSLQLNYQGVVDAADYASAFLRQLEANLPRDLGAGFTTIGPHRDDLEVRFSEAPITSVASRGEMRSMVLALKLAELAYMQEQDDSNHPLLLLDDVFSELDNARRQHLLGLVADHQVVITTTDADIGEALGSNHTTIRTDQLQPRASGASR